MALAQNPNPNGLCVEQICSLLAPYEFETNPVFIILQTGVKPPRCPTVCMLKITCLMALAQNPNPNGLCVEQRCSPLAPYEFETNPVYIMLQTGGVPPENGS